MGHEDRHPVTVNGAGELDVRVDDLRLGSLADAQHLVEDGGAGLRLAVVLPPEGALLRGGLRSEALVEHVLWGVQRG